MLKELQATIEEGLSFFDHPIIHTMFITFVALYASVLAPRLPGSVAKLTSSTIFKIFFFFVVVFLAQKDPRVALITALAYIFTVQAMSKFNILDKVNSLSSPSPSGSYKTPTMAVYSDPAIEVSIVDPPNVNEKPYEITNETEVGIPLHEDGIHAGTQCLGQPISGYDSGEVNAPW